MRINGVVLGALMVLGLPSIGAGASLRATLVLPEEAKAALPAVSGRLTPPTSAKGARRIAFADARGSLSFNVDDGSYLFEILVGDRLLFQKVLTLKGSTHLRVDATGAAVRELAEVARVTVGEKRHAVLSVAGNRVAVYVGDITDDKDRYGKQKGVPVVVFRPGPGSGAKVTFQAASQASLGPSVDCPDVNATCDVKFQSLKRNYVAVVGFDDQKDTADVRVFPAQ